jgi:hypothetical protein
MRSGVHGLDVSEAAAYETEAGLAFNGVQKRVRHEVVDL